MNEFFEFACPNCGWRNKRTRVALAGQKSIACPDCFGLHSVETAKAAAIFAADDAEIESKQLAWDWLNLVKGRFGKSPAGGSRGA
jgi:hypothetical protein